MRDRRKTTAVVVASGVALASAGFAIGSQRDDGSADAADRSGAASGRTVHFQDRGGPGRRGFFGLDTLADKLGVSEADLRKALDELRPMGDPKDDLAAFLAQALGKDKADVEKAFEDLRGAHDARHEQMHDEFAAALAKELGLDADEVGAALDKVRPEPPQGPPPRRLRHRGGPDALVGDLAKELGVTRAKLRAALRTVRPGPGPGGPHGPGGPGGPPHGPGGPLADDLASKLGVDAAAVEEALEDFHMAKRDEFAQKLADKLGIDVDKVKEALPDRP